jgi:plasmid stabilization system protein ParE
MKNFRLSPQAALDLAEIWNFIGIERQNPDAASGQVEMIYEKFCMLAENPLLGELRKDFGENLRSFTAGSYAVIYRPSSDEIEIARVVHAARDIRALFKGGK